MTLRRVFGPYTILGLKQDLIYGPRLMVHVVLKDIAMMAGVESFRKLFVLSPKGAYVTYFLLGPVFCLAILVNYPPKQKGNTLKPKYK